MSPNGDQTADSHWVQIIPKDDQGVWASHALLWAKDCPGCSRVIQMVVSHGNPS